MSIENFYLYNVIFLLFLLGCSKIKHLDPLYVDSRDKKLAVNDYKMGMLELNKIENGETRYRKALHYVEKAIKQSKNPIYMAQKATLLFLLNNVDESLKCFQEALKIPAHESVRSDIMNNYACVIAKTGDTKKALLLFEKLEKDKNYFTPEVAIVNQARIYYDDGKFNLAKKKLCQATRLAQDYVDAHYYLGLTCYRLENYKDAMQALDKTIQLESGHEAAISLREECCKKLTIC